MGGGPSCDNARRRPQETSVGGVEGSKQKGRRGMRERGSAWESWRWRSRGSERTRRRGREALDGGAEANLRRKLQVNRDAAAAVLGIEKYQCAGKGSEQENVTVQRLQRMEA